MSEQLKISFNKLTGDYTIDHDGFRWVSDGRLPYVIIRKKIGTQYRTTYRTLQSATKKTVKQDGKSVTCRYEKFVAFGKVLDFALVTNAHIEDGNSVVFSIKAENETGYDIRAVYFPAPFNSKKKGQSILSCRCHAPGLHAARRIQRKLRFDLCLYEISSQDKHRRLLYACLGQGM